MTMTKMKTTMTTATMTTTTRASASCARRAARGLAMALLVLGVLAACRRETGAEPLKDLPAGKKTAPAAAAAAASPATAAAGTAPAKQAPAPVAPAAPRAAKGCAIDQAQLPAGKLPISDKGTTLLRAFCLDRTEVTVAAYRACVDAGKCTEPDTEAGEACNWDSSGDPATVVRGKHPINCVDQAQAKAYCAFAGKRLAAAPELEWAQRGAEAGTPYPWGDDELPRRVCSRANKNPDYPRAPVTCPVGSCPSGDSPHKVQDLSGNVAEWTLTTAPMKIGGKGAPPPAEVLVCGGQTSCQAGSINRVGKSLTAGACLAQDPKQKFEGVGFRCASSL